jgi:DnaA-homolog protein
MNSSAQLPFDFSLQKSFTFEDFVVTEKNLELFASLKDQEKLSEQFYFIWGASGAGKSHFMQAFCQSREDSVYVPLKKFSQYGADILTGLENMEFVCLDDIETVIGNKNWEEGLFGFFNNIREQGNKLIVSASCSPRNLKTQLADLDSRLNWGIVYQLHELAESEKLLALRKRAASRGIPLTDDVLDYILLRSPRNMNVLFEVLDTLDRLSLAEKRRITIPFVKVMMDW